MTTARKILTAVFATAIVAGFTPGLQAGDKLPSGEKVMDMCLKSTGGKKAHKRIKNRVVRGTMVVNVMGQEMKMSLTYYTAASNKIYLNIQSDMMGIIERGFDGEVAWMMHPMMGNRRLTGDEGDLVKQQAFFYSNTDWRKIYKNVECVERTQFGGMPCYKVVLTPRTGREQIAYFETDTWLQRGSETKMNNPMGEITIVATMKEYKEVDGLLIPHRIEQTVNTGMMTQEIIITFESIEHNVDMPKDRFDLPAEIAALVQDDGQAPTPAPAPKDKK